MADSSTNFPIGGQLSDGNEVNKADPAETPDEDKAIIPGRKELPDSGSEVANDISGPEQKKYPGVINRYIKMGGNDGPTVFIYYPQINNAKIDTAFREFAQKLASGYEEDAKDAASIEEEKPSSYGMWEMTGFFTVEKPSANFISVTFNIYSYTGGAHGDIAITVMNYDLRDGNIVTFNDLFGKPEKALELLSALSIEKLRKSLGDDVEEEMLLDGASPKPENFANLSLLPDGVAVEFQPYQVGPWSIGQQHVEISLRELEEAAPSKTVWPQLAEH